MARKSDYGIWTDPRKPQAKQRADGKWICVAKASAEFPTETGRSKQFKRIADTKEEAEVTAWTARNKWEREQRLGISNDKEDRTKPLKILMEEHLKERLKHAVRYGGKTYRILSGSTYKNYVQQLNTCFYKSRFSELQASMITLPKVNNFLNLCAKGHNYSTLNCTTVCLNSLFAELYYKGLIPENFMLSAKPDILPEKNKDEITKEYLTDDDIRTIYNAFKSDHGRHRQYAAYILMIETGIRQQELFALRLQNIDKENRVILINTAISERFTETFLETGKGKKYELYEKELKGKEGRRLLKISDYSMEAIEQLERQLEQLCKHNPRGLLMPIYKNGEWNYLTNFENNWIADCKRLGIERPKKFGPHKTRHTGTTIMETRTDNNTQAIMQMVGHKSEAVHRIYTHQDVKAVQAIQTPMETLKAEEKASEKAEEARKIEGMTEEDKELFLLYKKLKDKFGDL